MIAPGDKVMMIARYNRFHATSDGIVICNEHGLIGGNPETWGVEFEKKESERMHDLNGMIDSKRGWWVRAGYLRVTFPRDPVVIGSMVKMAEPRSGIFTASLGVVRKIRRPEVLIQFDEFEDWMHDADGALSGGNGYWCFINKIRPIDRKITQLQLPFMK